MGVCDARGAQALPTFPLLFALQLMGWGDIIDKNQGGQAMEAGSCSFTEQGK
jgi:hypothetical protein